MWYPCVPFAITWGQPCTLREPTYWAEVLKVGGIMRPEAETGGGSLRLEAELGQSMLVQKGAVFNPICSNDTQPKELVQFNGLGTEKYY